MGKARYAWVTAGPLVVLTTVTFAAGLMKIFSPTPLGFLFTAKAARAAGETSKFINNTVDAVVTGMFLVFVLIIVSGCAREWVKLLRGTRRPVLHEGPYVPLASLESLP